MLEIFYESALMFARASRMRYSQYLDEYDKFRIDAPVKRIKE
jgi:hypothetical protein